LRAARLRVSGYFWKHRWAKALLLLGPPLLAFAIVYLASLAALFVSSFWSVNPFTTEIERIWNIDNYRTIFESSAYRTIALRTIGIAAAVTLTDALLAFPFAYFMARVARPRSRAVLFVMVLLPLWSSYLVRVYIWRLILNENGVLNWTLRKLGLPAAHLAYSNYAVWLTFSYVWLPFMILPIYGALERIPESLVEASRDLGAKGFETFRRVILPLALPGVVAGSIFTFSLTLGDYVTPLLAGGSSSQFIGNVVYGSVGIANNVPFAAAFAAIPLAVMAVYLLIARRMGAFEAM
jgi:putative spermidine/putrescine transport system permease protein